MKILVCVDLQNDFISGALGTPEAQAIVPNVVEKIKKHNEDINEIFCTYDTHGENYLETPEGKMLPVKHCIYETEGWMLDKRVRDALSYSELEFYKPTFGSFDLIKTIEEIYFDRHIPVEEIEVVGLCTDICVISNVLMLKAAFYDKCKITVDASCCAGVTPEKHRAALEVMKSCQINVINE